MSVTGREALEQDLRSMHERGAHDAAAKLALEAYGPEVLGLLLAVLRDHDAAAEVYAEFSANLWTALPKFRWESSFRTWAYTIARNAAWRFRRDPLRKRAISLDGCPQVDELPQPYRTATATFQQTAAKQSVSDLRNTLDPEDQLLLVLRIDRGLSWDEIAQVVSDAPAVEVAVPDAKQQRKKAAAALRKRFERLKSEIRARLAEAGPLRPALVP